MYLGRIRVQSLHNQKIIFGALNFELTNFEGCFVRNSQPFLLFSTKNHGLVFCERQMLKKIHERLIENNKETKIVEIALQDNCYKLIN